MVKSKANEAGLSLRAVDLPQNTLLSGDRLRIKQVVLNLLSNAIKFTDRGGEISVQAQREEDGSLAIAVADTGIGMAVEDVPQAFAQFGQIDMVDSRSQGGVGLGLYLCRRYMELHDGTIEVKSKPDKGTRITIRFPRARAICSLRESAAL